MTFTICIVLRLRGGGYPQYILDHASRLDDDNERVRSLSYPLYGKILNYWFPPAEGYDLCSYWIIPDTGNMITFVVESPHHHPLLLVEVKAPSDFKLDSGRNAAIVQVIQRLDAVGPKNQYTDRLYAISAIGKKWRACYTSKGKGSEDGQPINTVAEANSLRSADVTCWNPDVTSDASWEALQSIVETIKGYVVQ